MLSKSIKKDSNFYRQFVAVAFIGLMLAFLVAVLRVNASMAAFVVNTTADTQDAMLSDNICADVTGACSLRAAITQANFSIGPDIITLPAGTYTITLIAANEDLNAGGDFDILSYITINGAGSDTTIIQANPSPSIATERVFDYVNPPNRPEGWFSSVANAFAGNDPMGLSGITIRNGNLISGNGGGVRIARANTDLTISGSTISGNTAAQEGGGVWNDSAGTLTLHDSTVSGNRANQQGGGVWKTGPGALIVTNSNITNNTVAAPQTNTQGGGIFNNGGVVNISGSTISGNSATSPSSSNAGGGGGIQNLGGTVMITNSTIADNTSTVFAGINNSGTLTLTNSTVNGNTATGGGNFVGQGGGICNGGTVNIIDSTISNNSAAGQFGYAGGILNQGGANPAMLNVQNSTFSGNSAHDAGNIYVQQGTANIDFSTFSGNTAVGNGATIYVDQNGIVHLRNTIVANGTSTVGPNLFTFSNGVYNSQGFNFIESISGSNFVPQVSDMIGQDPLLGPLGSNGGPTQTFLPGATSPVINSIPSGTNECGVQFVTDQRGLTRPFGNGCDRGSVEVQDGTPAPLQIPLVVTGNDGDDSFNVNVFSPNGTLQRPIDLGPSFPGGRRVASGDVNGDGVPDIIVGAGPGGSHVKVFSGADGSLLRDFFAFDPGFTGGVFVGSGDVDNDGSDDIITGAGAGGGPHVRVFSGQTGTVLHDFMAFSPNFVGGVFVAGGDVNGDANADIIVGTGPGGGSQVKVFNGVGGFEIHGFINTDDPTDSGVPVGSADLNRDGFADIITGTGPGGGPHVKVFDGANVNRELASFFAFDPAFLGGVRVAGGDVNGDAVDDIIVGAGSGSPGPHVKVFSGTDGSLLHSFFAYDPLFQGGIFVAAAGIPFVGPTPTPTATPIPVRLIPPFVGVGPGPGATLDVRVFDPAGGSQANFTPFGTSFTGGVRVATGDINGDGTPDIITGAGDGSSRVRVFDGVNGVTLQEFFAFPGFTGGVFVASGDVSGDGLADIIVGAGSSAQAGTGGGPHVKVFDGQTHALHYDFFAYTGFLGGVRVAVGDVNGDGKADVITGPASGSQAHVKVFNGSTGAEIRSFFAFDPSFTGGVFVGAGDVNNDTFDDIVVGSDVGTAQHVKVFDGTNPGNVLHSFFAYGAGFQGGVRVAAGDVNGDGRADVITGAGPGGGPHVKVFSGLNGDEIGNFIAYTGLESVEGAQFQGGIFVTGASVVGGAGMGIEGDVSPRPDGNGSVISGDVIQMRRFATGLDTPSLDPNEFQRADSAPRTTFGDGMVNSGDVIQARRYATALDPSTPAAGPTGPPMISNAIPSMFADAYAYFLGREISVIPQKPSEDNGVTVAVEILPSGDEMAVGFTIEYDAAKLLNPRLALAEGAPHGSVLTVNKNEAGRIGVLVDSTEAFIASSVPKRFLLITFDVAIGAFGETPISLTDSLARKASADANGNTLSVRYFGGSVDVTGVGKNKWK